MRAGLVLGVMLALSAPLSAQTVAPLTGSTGTPAGQPPVASPAAPGRSPGAPPRRGRRTMQERFDEANTTHDGKLTLAQAQAKLPRVAREFDAIDTGHRGYVTAEEIRAYNRAQRAARRARPG